jgi:DNA-binding transcriptional MocR family regulator
LHRFKRTIALMANWQPRLSGRSGPKYQQIVDAIAEDIAMGALPDGTRLPPQRILAYSLDISPNTTGRAYAEAVKRGLLNGEVGRGTYVRAFSPQSAHTVSADMLRPAQGPIDFSRNLPTPGPAARYLRVTLAALQNTSRLQPFLDYQSSSDIDHHLDAAIDWLARSAVPAQRDEVVITNGAQHGLFSVLVAMLSPGDLLLTEALTYAPIRAMAERLGLRLASVAMDERGICPDALTEICQDRAPKALYLMPNLHTPTTLTIDIDRRTAIAEVARRHDLILIEDDVFGRLKPECPLPLASLAPERTIYITSISKCLSPGLRVGFVRTPAPHTTALRGAINLSCWMTPPLMVEIAARWIADGTAERLTEAQRTEAAARQALGTSILGAYNVQADPHGFHLWLRLPSHWSAGEFQTAAAKHGVEVTNGAAFANDPSLRPHAVRLGLSHEASRDRVEAGLIITRDLLREPKTHRAMII